MSPFPLLPSNVVIVVVLEEPGENCVIDEVPFVLGTAESVVGVNKIGLFGLDGLWPRWGNNAVGLSREKRRLDEFLGGCCKC